MNITKYEKLIALLFALLTAIFFLAMTNPDFFDWAFERHQNQLSWYIRPLFLIPFCYFTYRHNWAGISITVFGLFTSMFWFNKPEVVSDEVREFLQFEKDWLYGDWHVMKILLTLSIPISFTALAFALWKRSLWVGLAVIILMATGKIVWSIYYAGESGKSILIPAIVGLLLCTGLVFYGFKRLNKGVS